MNKLWCFIVLLFCFISNQDVLCDTPAEDKIVGGYKTTINEFPHQAYVLLQGPTDVFQCGGSIIDDQHILTAAHCLIDIVNASIRIGSAKSDSGGKVYESYSLIPHPAYSQNTSDYDVAVIKLREKMTLDGKTAKAIQLAAESSESIVAGTNILVSGWGANKEDGPVTEDLMAVKLPTISNRDCKKVFDEYITPRLFCTRLSRGIKDACQGDSGGAAINEEKTIQKGVVSFGIGCGRPDIPGVFVDVAKKSIRDFIVHASNAK